MDILAAGIRPRSVLPTDNEGLISKEVSRRDEEGVRVRSSMQGKRDLSVCT